MVLVLASCGGGTSATTAYMEMHDATNNSNVGGTPEDTGLVLGAGGSIAIDGQVDSGHYDSEDLDYDAYTFTVSADTSGTLMLSGADANAALHFFDVSIINSSSYGVGEAKVDAPKSVQLPAGVYKLELRAENPTPITASYPYTIEIAP
jgi:hypothetical protein